ncbi:MAG: hypothetical protein RBS48_00620 [Ignavibacteriaceae bacterium]|jgi:hypothetical protein|nr:hypothetical protein [Ignavibacteriaceae bacterium]
MKPILLWFSYFLVFVQLISAQNATELSIPTKINLKSELSKTVIELSDRIIANQIIDTKYKNYGAIECPSCNVLHTRAAESVYPLIISYQITGDKKYLNASIILADWLFNQQEENGSWKETPEEWTGTTTDQILMLALTYPLIQNYLSPIKKEIWENSIQKGADYLYRFMTPEFASINYCATTSATLATSYKIIPDSNYLIKAKDLAHRIISKMDQDLFIQGEGGREHNNKYGVDLGYNLEMSLWGLGLYAELTHDNFVKEKVMMSINNHLYFIYPDGMVDNSWGIRSNKWTIYGGATSDGSITSFMLYADKYPSFAAAAYRNLLSIRDNIENGYLTYGNHYSLLFDDPPCIYPTFTKAKSIAMGYQLAKDSVISLEKIPSDIKNWTKNFETLDLDLIRTKNYMATISAYGYKDYDKREKSKYMYRPSGGSITNLWIDNYGLLQAASSTEYHRWEPMSFPEIGENLPLTPRIEYSDSTGYFTNLFEFDARQNLLQSENGTSVKTTGELRDRRWLAGGVNYSLIQNFTDNIIEKEIVLTYHDSYPEIKIVEPIIFTEGMIIEKIDPKNILIKTPNKKFLFTLILGEYNIVLNRNEKLFFAPYPALKALPIYLDIDKPINKYQTHIKYQILIMD